MKVVVSHFPVKTKLIKKLNNGNQILGIGSHRHRESFDRRHGATGFITGSLYLKPCIPIVNIVDSSIKVQLIDF